MQETTPDKSNPTLNKQKTAKPKSLLKKIDPQTAKTLLQIKEKANRKDFGRKVQEKEILGLAIRLVTEEHIKELQAQTYSERDRLAMAHEEFQKVHGKLTLDQFIGKLLKGEVKVQANDVLATN